LSNRIKHDHYPTPSWMTESLIKYANIQGTIFECCCGENNAIAYEFTGRDQDVITNDLHFEADYNLDATVAKSWEIFPEVDWVVTNPPFNQYLQILRHALEKANIGVAFLLRVTADEMVMLNRSRYEWWADHPESLSIKMPRYCFAKSSKHDRFSTDSAYCQWFVWRKDNYQYPQPIIRLPHNRINNFHRQPIEM
jgi:hypothetical protein